MPLNLAAETAVAAFDAFAEPITFAGQESRGIPSTELVELGGYERVIEKRMTVAVLIEEVPEIQKGQLVLINGKSFKVDQILDGKENPDVLAKVILR